MVDLEPPYQVQRAGDHWCLVDKRTDKVVDIDEERECMTNMRDRLNTDFVLTQVYA